MKKLRFLHPIIFLLIAAGFSAAVMLLWNWLMPAIFSLGMINFWQALGMLILSRILFGSYGMYRMHDRKNFIRKKWMQMTPEQRQEFINKRMKHFNRGDFFGERDFDSDAKTSQNNE
jgi:hypothetical protein